MLISSDWLKIKLSCSNCCTLTDLVLFDLETPKYIYSVVHVPAQHILLFGMCAASSESYCICQKTAYFIICSWMQELLYCFRLLYIQSNCTIYMYGRFWTWFYWVLGDWVHKEWTDRPTFICTWNLNLIFFSSFSFELDILPAVASEIQVQNM